MSPTIAFTFRITDISDELGDCREIEIEEITQDILLRYHGGEPIEGSSMIREDLSCAGWDCFLSVDEQERLPPGLYSWAGSFWSRRDYEGEYDCGYEPEEIKLLTREQA